MAFLPPADVNGVFNLLMLMSEPGRAKQMLDEMKTQQETYLQSFQNVEKEKESLGELKKSIKLDQSVLDNLRMELEKKKEEIVAREKKQALSESALKEREMNVTYKESDLASLATTIGNRESSVTARENLIISKEEQFLQKEHEVATLKSDLEQRLLKLKEFIQ